MPGRDAYLDGLLAGRNAHLHWHFTVSCHQAPTAKASAAQMFKMNTLALINGIVTGAAGIAALPIGM
jgi:hypothetical protein